MNYNYNNDIVILVINRNIGRKERKESVFKNFCMITLGIIMFCLLAACETTANKTKIDFKVGFKMVEGIGSESKSESIIISLDEWNEFSTTREYLSELNYDAHYFIDNSLIVYIFTKGTGNNQMDITRISKKNNELVIDIDVTLGTLDMITYGIFIIEIKKADITNVNSLRIVEN